MLQLGTLTDIFLDAFLDIVHVFIYHNKEVCENYGTYDFNNIIVSSWKF